MSRSLKEWFIADRLNGMNFLDWESRLRTWLTVANELIFIDGPCPQRPNLRVDHPSHVGVYVRILSRGKEIVKVIVQNISLNLRDALEAFLRQYVLIVETVSTYDLCMKVMHMIMRRMPWDLEDFSMDIWHGFMKELHEFLFDSDWDQLSHPPDIVCMEYGSDMVPKLRAKGNRMNDEKFGTFEEMDGYASGPDEEDTHNSFSICFLKL
ncbi:hypothetical protein Tco_1505941 [Tanacetum coccineum]